eukprot:SAG31_NODE_694_length_12769_cov_8.102447_8_plen_69_part_00
MRDDAGSEGHAWNYYVANGSLTCRRQQTQVRSYFLVFVPTIREIRDFYREMQRTNRESVTMYTVRSDM